MTSTQDPTSANIRAEMARRGMTQTELAAILNVAQPAVSARLRGKTSWRVDELRALAAALDTTVAHLMGDASTAGAA